MRWLRVGMVATIASGALVLPVSAVAQISSISIGQAQLGAQGASVSLPVTVTCDPGFGILFVDMSVAQSTGHRLAQGSSTLAVPSGFLPCSTPATVTLSVPDANPFAFKNGEAAATATVFVENPSTGVSDQTVTQTVRIVKK